MRTIGNTVIAIVMLMMFVQAANADVTMPSVFADHMVLQRDMNVPVWGHAAPKERVTVEIAGQRHTVRASKDSTWRVLLDPMSAGGPYSMTVTGKNTVVLDDILIGDVWLCSGQSNMEMKVRHCKNGLDEVAESNYPRLRLFQVANCVSPVPLDDCEGTWEVSRPTTVAEFSGAAYFFGREIHKETDVPVGLMHASWGGTTVETWMSLEPLTTIPEFRFIMYRWDDLMSERSPEVIDYFNDMGAWHEDLFHQLASGYYDSRPIVPPRPAPDAPTEIMWLPHVPTWCYNGMIAPLAQYGIKGAVWYQGESNAGRAYQYRTLFPALIRDWRRIWGQGDFPFIFTQLANYGVRGDGCGDDAWAELREAQLMTLDVPNTAMAVTIDIGEADDIHPVNKQEVGRRLALGALHTAYGRDIAYSGPIYRDMTIEGNHVTVRFDHAKDGLLADVGESPRGFAIAGADSQFVPAKAMIVGSDIVVWNDDIKEPVAVRYGWDINPECNLYNRAGLPASPFRTDDWPGITVENK